MRCANLLKRSRSMIPVRHLGRALVVCLLALQVGCTRGAEHRVAGDWDMEPEVAQVLQANLREVMRRMNQRAGETLSPRLHGGCRLPLDTDWTFRYTQTVHGQAVTASGTWDLCEAQGDKITIK